MIWEFLLGSTALGPKTRQDWAWMNMPSWGGKLWEARDLRAAWSEAQVFIEWKLRHIPDTVSSTGS